MRPVRCEVARQPAPLGIAPVGDQELAVTEQGVFLMRSEGGTPELTGSIAARLVSSPLGSDGVLGAATTLAGEAGFTYIYARIVSEARFRLAYVARSEAAARSYHARPLTDVGTPDGRRSSSPSRAPRPDTPCPSRVVTSFWAARTMKRGPTRAASGCNVWTRLEYRSERRKPWSRPAPPDR
jgi:hypothetical protein